MDRLEKLRTLSIAISVDGPKEVHDELRGKGVYDKAVATLKELHKRNINSCISSVIMRNTIDRLNEIVDLADDLGIHVISLQPYQRETAGPDKNHDEFEFKPEEEKPIRKKLKLLIRYAEKKNIHIYTDNLMKYVPPYLSRRIRPIPQGGCLLPSRQINVYSDGECRPCFFLGRSAGNIYELSLNEIWHNTIHRELIHLALNRKCPGCLAACSDIVSFKSRINKERVFELIRHVVKGVRNKI
jgi:MoaA/NifB/PqqE/SkfB family radical SAM enzyme